MKALPQAIAGANFHIGIMAGKVERRDAGHHAQGLAHGIHIDAGTGAVGELTLEQVRNAAGELANLDTALNVTVRIRDRLAVLHGEHLGQRFLFAGDQLQELKEHPGAHLRVLGGPGRLCGGRVLDRGAHLVGAGKCDLGLHLPGIGVVDIAEATARTGNSLAADEMSDFVCHDTLPV